ncbi:disease resistance protein RPM1-like [Ananas comosus]|uniref:Disease resistance protein RPM1-like n=1 Tax=Ananas comosus TaxID=4615 RepID=A0A6P5FBX2_ANACO|nr:disease resistance protein RPM1-like [Ananas comosus]XP_020093086.1 disease resistance protein RPM1-like [Ananas comosus]XP_020093087.1 disease resistance protein RPM1-like [Ananas comosus]
MAEVAILLAIQKLGLALGTKLLNQASSLFSQQLASLAELPGRMETIMRELCVMRQFLLYIDKVDSKNQVLEAWIEEVRKVAYTIEDIVDEYIYLIDQDKQRRGGLVGYMKQVSQQPESFNSLPRIASQIKQVENGLDHLSRLKDRWIIQTTSIWHSSSSDNVSEWTQHLMGSSSLSMCEEQLVGVDEDRHMLTNWLRSEKLDLCIITVWGMGGLGKTTLVTNVYKRESRNFDCRAWISISQTFKIEDLRRKIITELFGDKKKIPINIATMDVIKLKETLREFLEQKKYLIVLDDVWEPRAFYELQDSLVDNQKGSRIFITTRNAEVASLANKNYKLKLEPLSDPDAWKLFCKRAFWNYENQECPPELEKSARDIVDKCEGLPLAIVSLGNLLSLGRNSETELKRVYDQLNWELANRPILDPVRNILNLSFNYLPKYLRNCILSCSMFPEDFLLKRKRLIRLWIAEGFAVERGSRTAEEVAEGYLVELIHRNMLQVEERNHFGRVKYCRMHDLVREFAVSLSKKEKFHVIYEDNEMERMVGANARRLSVLKYSNDIGFNIDLQWLRTFVAFNTTMPASSFTPVFPSKSRYIAILELQGLPIEEIPNAIGDLFNLRYLGLRRTKVKLLPKSIGKLSNLLILDLYESAIQKLPCEITNLKKLRHMFVERENDPTGKAFRWGSGVRAPKGLWNLKELQTLQAVEASSELVGRLGNLTNLRSFRIWNVKETYSKQLCASLSQMRSLSYLSINASDENEKLNLEGLKHPLPNLKKLTLTGRLAAETLTFPLFRDLRQLCLSWCQLTADPLPSLAQLSNLTFLQLERAYNGEQLCFCVQWFPNLKRLDLIDLPQLQRVKIEMTAMSNLETLYLRYLKNLTEVPEGIEFLTSLWELYFYDMEPQLTSGLEENDKLRHISFIYTD